MPTQTQPVLTTARLTLRPPELSDAFTFNESIRASLAELKPFMPWVDPVPTVDQSRENIACILNGENQKKETRYLAFESLSGEFVGCIGLHLKNESIPFYEIGYWIDSRKSGRGYMTEAVSVVTNYALHQLGARRVEIQAALCNEKSWKIAERLGYVREGVLHNAEFLPTGLIGDTVIYAKYPS